MSSRQAKRLRDLKYKRHLKHLYDIKSYWWFPPTYMNFAKTHYKRNYISDWKGTKVYKKYANRKVRYYKGNLPTKGSTYKKIFDLQRILY